MLPVGPQLIALAPSQETVQVADPAKPVPVTVTLSPTYPVDSDSAIAAWTVNVALALFVPSVPVTVWLPATSDGTVKLQLQLPVLSAVAVHRLAPPGDQLTVTDPAPA